MTNLMILKVAYAKSSKWSKRIYFCIFKVSKGYCKKNGSVVRLCHLEKIFKTKKKKK